MLRKSKLLCLMPLIALPTAAAAAPPATAPDPLAESHRLQAEIDALATDPAVKRVLDLQDQMNTKIQEQDDLERRISEVSSTPEWARYDEKRNELYKLRDDKWSHERAALAAAAKSLYQSRHQELAAHSAGNLPIGRALAFDPFTFPKIDGSTSTHPMALILTARLLGLSYHWEYPEPTGSPYPSQFHWMPDRFAWEFGISKEGDSDLTLVSCRILADGSDTRTQRAAALVNHVLAANTATHDAYEHLISGDCDINLTARPPTAGERKDAAARHVDFDLIPIATDALVFIVNRDNPVTSLSTDQLKNIYAGKLTRWSDLAGADQPIEALIREPDSGSRELFDALLMPTPPDPDHRFSSVIAGSMAGPFNQLTTDPRGIAYSVYYYEHFMALSPYTKTIAIDNISPSPDTLRSGKYPFIAPIYAALRQDIPADSPARKLVHYLQSPEGQKLLEEAGYVPISAPN